MHGFFINDPNLQYILLILIKVGLIFIVLKNQKLLKSWIRVSVCLYFLCGILIDVMCLQSIEHKLPQTEINFFFTSVKLVDLIGYTLIGLTAATVVFQIIIETME